MNKKKTKDTFCFILFVDIVGYSKLETEQQVTSFTELFNILHSVDSFRQVPSENIITIPTGDGFALVFHSEPSFHLAPLQVAIDLQREVRRRLLILPFRAGIHCGVNSIVENPDGGKNVIGTSINYAARVMSLGDANHILVSNEYYQTVIVGNAQYVAMCHLAGEYVVKHGITIKIFNVFIEGDFGNSTPPKVAKTIQEKKALSKVKAKTVYTLDELIDTPPAEFTGEIYGIALDIGTTTLAMYLIDLEMGGVLSVISRENPQTKYGNNVISRIEFARKGQNILEREIRTAVNEMITTLIDPGKVYKMVIVGNPVMRDLFFGYSVESLGKSPYEPLSVKPVSETAKELGLKANPEARVYGLPLVGGFVGADALAVVLATELYKSGPICMAIDIGTNTEIVLGNKDRLIVTSCAAGPAFEGAGITCGVGAVSGAIKEVRIVNHEIIYKTIDAAAPVGVCGSGLIDTLAELLDKRIIDGRGKFYGAEKEFKIAEGISLLEKDIEKLNLAKTAVSVGIKVLLERYGIELEEIDSIFLAGGFLNFTNTEDAIRIGLLPTVEQEKVKKVGNAAIEGARQALISRTKREEAEAVAKRIEHIKLEYEENFMEIFVSELYFQKYL